MAPNWNTKIIANMQFYRNGCKTCLVEVTKKSSFLFQIPPISMWLLSIITWLREERLPNGPFCNSLFAILIVKASSSFHFFFTSLLWSHAVNAIIRRRITVVIQIRYPRIYTYFRINLDRSQFKHRGIILKNGQQLYASKKEAWWVIGIEI